MKTKRYEVAIDFTEEDGEEEYDTFKVDAEDIQEAEKLALEELELQYDVEEVTNVEVVEK